MDKTNKDAKIVNRPYLISLISIILFIFYIAAPLVSGAWLYLRWEDPLIASTIKSLSSLYHSHMPQNYYLRMMVSSLTILVLYIIPLYLMMNLWMLKRKAVKLSFYICLLYVAVFYINFKLLDELIFTYSFLKKPLCYLFISHLVITAFCFLYRKRMD